MNRHFVLFAAIVLGAGFLFSCSGVKADPDSRDPDERRLGTLKLGYQSDAATVRRLVEFLNDPDDLVREAALISLGRIGRREFAQHIKEKLHDSSTVVRMTAARVLAHLEGQEALSVLIPVFKAESNGTVRTVFLEQIGTFPENSSAVDVLIGALGDRDPSVSVTALDLLIRVTGQKEIGPDRDRWVEWFKNNRPAQQR